MKKPFHNQSKTATLMIDGMEIPPGEVRHIEENLHPTQAAPAEINPNQTLVDLLAKSVKNISKELSELTLIDLKALAELEAAAEAPRSSLMETLEREVMTRAEAPNNEEYQRLKTLGESLEGKTLEELEALRQEEIDGEDRAGNLAVIDAAIERVKAGE